MKQDSNDETETATPRPSDDAWATLLSAMWSSNIVPILPDELREGLDAYIDARVRETQPLTAPTETTLCDCCASEVPVEESQTCYCGVVVCDRCMENEHYQCEDDEAQP